MMRKWVCLCLILAGPPAAHAHPVAKNTYDRTITVRLQKGTEPNQVLIRVDYRLEVDETTIVLEDMKDYRDEVDFVSYRNKPLEYYAEFTRIYAPILAKRLHARLDGADVELKPAGRSQRLVDEKGEALGHLRCDFVFEGTFHYVPAPGQVHKFYFKECNYQFYDGQINVSLVDETGLDIVSKKVPDADLQSRPSFELAPGDEDKLRELKLDFQAPASAPPAHQDRHESGLFRLVFHSDYGIWIMLVIATAFGAVHALTPGHGKTLVAAYLVGERGTIWHACLLGIVTTLTHTGVVLAIAVALFFSKEFGETLLAGLTGISLAVGIAIVCLGFYQLLARLSGRADHVHLGGGHHHHHGHNHSHDIPSNLSFWGLILLGISGGLIPCTDAIALLMVTVGTAEFWMALPLLLAFSAGLAGVLVLIGILVVKFRNIADSRWGEGRLVRALPVLSAVVVITLGFLLCYETIHTSSN